MSSRSFPRPLAPLFLAFTLALAACDGSPVAAPPAVAEVHVTPEGGSLVVGDALQLVAVPRSAGGDDLEDRVVTWATSDAGRATISAGGVLTALAPGDVDVIATSEGVSATVAFEVAPLPATVLAFTIGAMTMVEGDQAALEAVARNARGEVVEHAVIAWSSDAPTVVAVDASGAISATGEGTATITATHGALLATATITVRPDLGAELLYDISAGTPIAWPHVYRLDLRAGPGASLLLPDNGMSQASASPDGSRVAFACGAAICTADRDGGDVQVLIEDASNEDQPAWSPDGTRIAFRRWAAGGTPGPANPTDIWVMNADGSDPVNLTADAGVQHRPAWSPMQPDGSYRIVFTDEALVDGHLVSRLATMRSDGTDRQFLTSAGEHVDESPTWSPDGRTVVFVRTGNGAMGDLWQVTVATGAERAFLAAELPGAQRGPRWSPDGRHVVFTSAHEPSASGAFSQLYTARADGTHVIRRTDDAGEKEHPNWLPRP